MTLFHFPIFSVSKYLRIRSNIFFQGMRLIFQRVLHATVLSQEKSITGIDKGMLVYLGFAKGDNTSTIKRFASKVLKVRVWKGIPKQDQKEIDLNNEKEPKEEEKSSPTAELKRWETCILDNDYEVLVVPMSALFWEIPDEKVEVVEPLSVEENVKLYNQFIDQLKKEYKEGKIKGSGFGDNLQLKIVIDGPVTLLNDGQ